MNQCEMIYSLVDWLDTVYPPPRYSVRCDHTTSRKQTLGLYIGEKRKRSGRENQIAQPDIVVCDDASRRLELIVEVEPNPNPKTLISQILPALLADNYTPSKALTPVYAIRDTAVVVVTEIATTEQSQKFQQIEAIQLAIHERFKFQEHGIKAIRICCGSETTDCLTAFKAVMQEIAEGRVPSRSSSRRGLPCVTFESVER